MMLKKMMLISLCVCLVFVPCGCWDARDIDDKTVVVTVITDKEDDGYAFYIECPNLSTGQQSEGGNESQKYSIVYAQGATFAEARRQLNFKVDKPLFLGTVKSLVLTDELGKHGIEEYMMRLQSDLQYRKTLIMVTSFTDPNVLMEVEPINNVSIGESIDDTVNNLEINGKIVAYNMSDILEYIYSDACYIMINMDVIDGFVAFNGFTVFKENKLTDFIPVEESRGLVWILGNGIIRLYVVPFDDTFATVEVTMKSRKIEPFYTDGKLKFDVSYEFESKVQTISSNTVLNKAKQDIVKKNLLNNIIEDIEKSIRHSKELECDYLHFKEYFRIKYPNISKEVSWDELFQDTEFHIRANTTLSMGNLMDYEATRRPTTE